VSAVIPDYYIYSGRDYLEVYNSSAVAHVKSSVWNGEFEKYFTYANKTDCYIKIYRDTTMYAPFGFQSPVCSTWWLGSSTPGQRINLISSTYRSNK
jgi:hypothetical protein